MPCQPLPQPGCSESAQDAKMKAGGAMVTTTHSHRAKKRCGVSNHLDSHHLYHNFFQNMSLWIMIKNRSIKLDLPWTGQLPPSTSFLQRTEPGKAPCHQHTRNILLGTSPEHLGFLIKRFLSGKGIFFNF